jgi:hypothetical protein
MNTAIGQAASRAVCKYLVDYGLTTVERIYHSVNDVAPPVPYVTCVAVGAEPVGDSVFQVDVDVRVYSSSDDDSEETHRARANEVCQAFAEPESSDRIINLLNWSADLLVSNLIVIGELTEVDETKWVGGVRLRLFASWTS